VDKRNGIARPEALARNRSTGAAWRFPRVICIVKQTCSKIALLFYPCV
jgi:hypothetical protein